MITVAIDAATYVGTVAVLRDGGILASGEAIMRGRESEALMPAVAGALATARVSPSALDRVVCGAGPGSFTSLRIAASIAKGLAFGAGCQLYAVSSLLLTLTADPAVSSGRYLAVLDALRGEAYVAGYTVEGDGRIGELLPEQLVRQADLPQLAESLGTTTVGPAQALDRSPHARGVARLSDWIAASNPVDLSAWEPQYGRKAEAQVRWEAAHGQPLPSGGSPL